MNATTEVIKGKLKDFNITIPDVAEIKSVEEGSYVFTVDKNIVGDILTYGVLSCSYYNDDSIKYIRNDLVAYKKVKDINIISEMEAYEKVTKGKFAYRMDVDKINTLQINNISLDYRLDSKGYLQPVYIFNSIINEEPFEVFIPALS